MRDKLDLNLGWRFSEDFRPEYARPDFKDNNFKLVDLPHCVRDVPANYVCERDFQTVTCYRKTFVLPDSFFGRKVLLHFDGVMCCAAVLVNGKPACAHKGGFAPFVCSVGELLKRGDNTIAVIVDSNERQDTSPNTRAGDQLLFGGIYRQVWMETVPDVYIDDCCFFPKKNGENYHIVAEGRISQPGSHTLTLSLYGGIGANEKKKMASKEISFEGQDFSFELMMQNDVTEWSMESPVLYTVSAQLETGDELSRTFGFRTARFEQDGFYLNGRKIKLIGTARGQEYSRCGFAAPAELQEFAAHLIKALGFNCVRTLHSPPDRAFLDECDRIGLLVVEESQGWRSIGDETWQANHLEALGDLVRRDRSHPSIIAYSVRPEGAQDDVFFTKCRELVRSLDESRQFLGFRSFTGGSFEEDVFVYSDLAFGETSVFEKKKNVCRLKVPYMVNIGFSTEFAVSPGHSSERKLKAALLWAKALDTVLGDDDICGGFFGMLSDYHAHEQLGLGDGLISTGLTDCGRVPKLTAALFASQQDERPVMELSSLPLGTVFPGLTPGEGLYIFTNCDRIKIYRGKQKIVTLSPSSKKFPNLPHPPVLVDDLIGEALIKIEGIELKESEAFKKLLLTIAKAGENLSSELKVKINLVAARNGLTARQLLDLAEKYVTMRYSAEEYVVKGFVDGKAVASVTLEPVRARALVATPASDAIIQTETYGCTRVEVCAVDQNGNVLSRCCDVVSVETDGSVDMIGPREFALSGGRAGVFVRTKGGKGTARVNFSSESLGKCSVVLSVDRRL